MNDFKSCEVRKFSEIEFKKKSIYMNVIVPSQTQPYEAICNICYKAVIGFVGRKVLEGLQMY